MAVINLEQAARRVRRSQEAVQGMLDAAAQAAELAAEEKRLDEELERLNALSRDVDLSRGMGPEMGRDVVGLTQAPGMDTPGR